jgi:hypothetical protein
MSYSDYLLGVSAFFAVIAALVTVIGAIEVDLFLMYTALIFAFLAVGLSILRRQVDKKH